MMLDARATAEKAKFAADRDAAFKAHAHRDRMFGRGAADLRGHRGEAAEGYARDLMRDDVKSADDARILVKVGDDLGEASPTRRSARSRAAGPRSCRVAAPTPPPRLRRPA